MQDNRHYPVVGEEPGEAGGTAAAHLAGRRSPAGSWVSAWYWPPTLWRYWRPFGWWSPAFRRPVWWLLGQGALPLGDLDRTVERVRAALRLQADCRSITRQGNLAKQSQ
jgi:hypothetical protein